MTPKVYGAGVALAFAVGFFAAWYIQGVRLDAAHNKFTEYKLEQERIVRDHNYHAAKRLQETSDGWAAAVEMLQRDRKAYERCVAAGKCGAFIVRVPVLSSDREADDLPPAPGADGTGADAVPAAGGVAAPPAVLDECALTTLQLNALQSDIERQKGYGKP
jgi:hypothetical protein